MAGITGYVPQAEADQFIQSTSFVPRVADLTGGTRATVDTSVDPWTVSGIGTVYNINADMNDNELSANKNAESFRTKGDYGFAQDIVTQRQVSIGLTLYLPQSKSTQTEYEGWAELIRRKAESFNEELFAAMLWFIGTDGTDYRWQAKYFNAKVLEPSYSIPAGGPIQLSVTLQSQGQAYEGPFTTTSNGIPAL